MKRWNRILAALLAASMLCAALGMPVVADEGTALDDGGVILPAQGAAADGLEIGPEDLPELMPEDAGFDLDDDVVLSGNLDQVGNGGSIVLPSEEELAGTEANASSDFVIRNNMLVEYKGKGGDVVIPNNVDNIGDNAFLFCHRLTSVKIHNGVYRIGAFAFQGCDRLTSVTIPDSVYIIGKGAFSACQRLMDIKVSRDNGYFASQNGLLYTYNMKTLLQCPGGRTDVTIPKSVTKIRDYAFCGCESLTSVTIPDSITDIGEAAFLWCHKLTSAIILSKKINLGDAVFNFCPVVMHIISGSDAIAWAKKAGEQYDIIKISDSSIKLKTGQTHELTVTALKSDQLTWSSSNKKVATVSGGKVKAVGAGKCTVSAKIVGGGTLSCTVTVTDPAKLSKTSLTISVVDSATVKLTGVSGKKVTWTSSKSGVAKITESSNGSVTVVGVKPGTAVIKAQIAGGQTLKCTVKVVAPLEMTMVKIVNESGKRILHTRLANRSSKKITYIKFDILQYDSRNQRLASSHKGGFDLSETIKAHASTTKRIDVNGQTDHVKYSIEWVRFSDGTTWKP